MTMSTGLKSLFFLRYLSVFLALGLTAATSAAAIKAILQVIDNRNLVKSFKGTLNVNDLQGAVIAMVVTAILGVGAALISELVLALERLRGLSFKLRIFNEIWLGITIAGLLGSLIAGTIISKRQAKITIPNIPAAMIPAAVEGMGRSVEYRKTWGWTAIQIGWGAFAALLIALVLILVTGVYHRRHKRQIAATQATQNVQDYHNVSEKGSI